jgi:RNA polymerase sigma factor (sigma-70 family)
MPPTHRTEDLFEHGEFLSRLARSLIRDEHHAADLVQDAWVAALERPPRDRSALGGWLARVVQRRAANDLRGNARRSAREAHAAAPEQQEPHDDALARLEVQRLVFDRVLALPEAQRAALYLRYYEGLGPTAIAERLGAPVKTVKTRLARGLTTLRAQLDEQHGGERDGWVAALVPLAYASPSSGGSAGPGALATTGILGGMAVKKLIALSLALLAAVAVWTVAQRGAVQQQSAAADSAAAEPALVVESEAPEPAETLEVAAAPAREVLALDVPTVDPTARLHVRFTWHDGAPAAELAVRAHCETDPSSRDEPFRGRTDEDGLAVFDALFAGPVRLRLDRGWRFDVAVTAGATTSAEFSLPEGERVEGRVVDARGDPVPGAEVWLWAGDSWNGSRAVTAGDDGSFHLKGLRGQVRVGARAGGYQPSLSYDPIGLPLDKSGARTATLELGAPGGSIRGRVLDPDGEPVAGARVHAGERGGHIVDPPEGPRGEAPVPASVATDGEGRFELPGDHAPGAVPIHAMARGFPVWSDSVNVAAGGASIEIALAHPARIQGQVLDGAGQPVENASVVCSLERGGGWYQDAFPPPRATTDADGRFQLETVPAGAQQLNAHPPRDAKRDGKAQASVTCTAGGVATCVLQLTPEPSIRGRVVDADGFALVGWRVRADPSGLSSGRVYPRSDTTDAGGEFLLANVGDCLHEVWASAPGEYTKLATVEAAAGARELVLTVERTAAEKGRVTGSLRDTDGSVPRDANLSIWAVGDNRGFFVEFDAASGAFDHEALVGAYVLRARRGGTRLVTSEPFEVTAGQVTDVGELRGVTGGRVEIVVRPPWTEVVGRVDFALKRSGRGDVSVEVVDGRLISKEVAPGNWSVAVHESELFVYEEVEVVSGQTTTVEVDVQRAFPLALELSFAENGWSEVRVRASNEAGLVLRDRTFRAADVEKRNSQVIVRVPEGRTVVEATTNTGLSATATFDVGLHNLTREAQPLALE